MTFDVSPVTDRVYLGGAVQGHEQAAWLAERGITHLVSAAIELSDRAVCRRHRLGYYHVRWHDDRQFKPPGDFMRALAWIRDEMAPTPDSKPIRIYVHCAMGINRGPLLATFLVAALEGISADEAWSLIKRNRPQAESFERPAYRHSCRLALAGYTVNAVPESVARAWETWEYLALAAVTPAGPQLAA